MGLGTRGLGDFGTWDSGTRGRGDVGTWRRGDVGKWGRGTWDLGLGTWDLGLGTWDLGLGTWDLGLGDAGTWDSGTPGTPGLGTRDSGTRDSKTLGLGDVGPTGLEDVINKQHLIFSLNLLITIFDALEKGINYAGEFVSSLVADDFQRPWFGLIYMFACLCYRESPDRYIIV